MSLSSSEIKHALRKSDFPFCARDALSRIEQLSLSQNVSQIQATKHMALAMEIMAEFVFCEVDRRGGKKRRLNCIQDLQLLEVLCDYFSFSGANSEVTQNTVFMSLFPPGHVDRSRLLAKLVSMAISTKNTPVLNATGIWMQQLGCTSKFSLDLAQGLVKDYFVLVPKAMSGLQDLPQLAPQFTANFLTAVAEMYGADDKRQGFSAPPAALLEVITQWVWDNPSLCLAALLVNPQVSLPLGSIPMAPVTPFAGLFKWCVLAPLQGCKGQESPLYSRLHLALLESLLECCSTRPNAREGVVSTQQLASIAELVARWDKRERQPTLQLALDRLAQAVQVALVTHCTYGNKDELLGLLKSLPDNRLLRVVITTHKKLL